MMLWASRAGMLVGLVWPVLTEVRLCLASDWCNVLPVTVLKLLPGLLMMLWGQLWRVHLSSWAVAKCFSCLGMVADDV